MPNYRIGCRPNIGFLKSVLEPWSDFLKICEANMVLKILLIIYLFISAIDIYKEIPSLGVLGFWGFGVGGRVKKCWNGDTFLLYFFAN